MNIFDEILKGMENALSSNQNEIIKKEENLEVHEIRKNWKNHRKHKSNMF